VCERLSWKPTPAFTEPTKTGTGMPVPPTAGPTSAASAEASVIVGLDVVQVAVFDSVLPSRLHFRPRTRRRPTRLVCAVPDDDRVAGDVGGVGRRGQSGRCLR